VVNFCASGTVWRRRSEIGTLGISKFSKNPEIGKFAEISPRQFGKFGGFPGDFRGNPGNSRNRPGRARENLKIYRRKIDVSTKNVPRKIHLLEGPRTRKPGFSGQGCQVFDPPDHLG